MSLIRENISFFRTNRDTHFTDQLITGASEYENLVVSEPGRLPCHITSVVMTAATRHDFSVAFYSRDVFHQRLAATPYNGAVLGVIHLDAAGSWQHGTEYVYATDFPAIQYLDEDESGELHVGLHNRDSKTKAALGAAGLPTVIPPQYIHIRFGLISAL